jgi:hypothetical protein
MLALSIYNLLNQLSLVKLEIDRNPTFSQDIANKFVTMTNEAKDLVEKISNVDTVDEAGIKNSIYPDQ